MFTGKYENGLYYLQATMVKGEANVAKTAESTTDIWNSRLGHMSSKVMKLLVKEGFMPRS